MKEKEEEEEEEEVTGRSYLCRRGVKVRKVQAHPARTSRDFPSTTEVVMRDGGMAH